MSWFRRIAAQDALRTSDAQPLDRPPAPPKRYHYVSDEKVDMCVQDLPRDLVERFDLTSFKLGVPGVVGAEASVRHLPDGRYARVKRLCEALEKNALLGSIDDGKPFIRGQMLARWGFWNRHDDGYADVVFYHGFLDANTFVGLGGSAYHTRERAEERLQQHSNSGIQLLMMFLEERSRKAGPYQWTPPGAWPSEAWEADYNNTAIPQSLEFVVGRDSNAYFDDDPDRPIRTFIGSPIYVAETSQPITPALLKEYEALRSEHAMRTLGRPGQTKPVPRPIGRPVRPQRPPLEQPKAAREQNT